MSVLKHADGSIMKKRYWIWLIFPVLVNLFSMKAYAGDLNGAEQGIISAISSVYAYNGGYYKVKDGYISQVSAYLSQDGVDLSSEDAAGYLSQFYSNIGTGISAGYMECVGTYGNDASDAQVPAVPETTETVSETTEDTEKESVNDTNNNSNNNDDNNNGRNNVNDSGKNESETAGKRTMPSAGIEDKTIGSTTDGVVDYTVIEVDHEKMYVWDIDVLNVYEQAYKDSAVIGTLNKGEEVTVTGASTTGWAQIDYNGETGYVSAVYLRTDGFMSGQEQETVQSGLQEKENAAGQESAAAEELLIETLKDYSDAPPVSKKIKIEWIAASIAVIFFIVSTAIVLSHKKLSGKSKKR